MLRLDRACAFVLTLLAGAAAHATSLPEQLFSQAQGAPALLQALGTEDRQAVTALLPLTLAPDGRIIDDTACRQAARPELSVVDLRHDGQPAVFVIAGNTCTSGGTGASLYLVAKADGRWHRYLGVPAIAYRVMPSSAHGWPEIGLLGRYPCLGVWQFDGTAYVHARNVDPRGAACAR
jgi:hypothetical protein